MKFEAAVRKQNPMLIQKIIAERLSDKAQIMMVSIDGKNFFTSDVMRSAFRGGVGAGCRGDDSGDPRRWQPPATQRKEKKRP
jgi:hypothetical protein